MDNADLNCSVPKPILNAAVTALKKMVERTPLLRQAELQPQPNQESYSLPRIPGLPKEHQSYVRRRKGFKSDPSYSISDKSIRGIVGGTEEVKKYLFQFTASLDGVTVFANSVYSNSVYIFSLFSENMPRRHMVKGLDAFFMFMIYCSESEPRTEKRITVTSSKVVDCGRNTVEPKITRDHKVKDPLEFSHTSPPDAAPGSKMANQDFHRILKVVLENMKERGKKGFVMRKGRVVFNNQYAITVIRADMPAGNLFLGFPGRHSSNQPCAQCKLRKRVLDPNKCAILERPELCVHKQHEQMVTLMTSVVNLPINDPLRLLRFSLWLENHPNSRALFEAALREKVTIALL